MKPAIAVLAVVLALPGAAEAQVSFVFPAEYANAWGRGSASVLASDSSRTQVILARPFPTVVPISGVGLRSTASTSDRASFTADVEIRMSSTARAPGALSAAFATNVGSDVVVALPRQMVNVPAMPANRSPRSFVRFPFAAPFRFGANGNPNLNVDILVFGRSSGASWTTDRGFATSSGRGTTAGQGCGAATIDSSATSGYIAGSTIRLSLSGAPSGAPAVLQGAANLSELLPGIPTPFGLDALGGAAGCDLLVNLALQPVPAVADVAGDASLPIAVPAAVSRVGTGWQWIYLVGASGQNALGLETTANRAIWIGPEVVLPAAQYVWNVFDVNSPTGNSATDACVIVEILI